MQCGNADATELLRALRALRAFLRENDMMAYLTMMAVRQRRAGAMRDGETLRAKRPADRERRGGVLLHHITVVV